MCFFPWYWSRKSFFLVLPWKWENEKFLSASSLRNALLRYTTTEPQRLYSELSHYKIHIFCITDILHTVKISIAKSVLCIDRIKKMVNFQAWWWNKERWFFFVFSHVWARTMKNSFVPHWRKHKVNLRHEKVLLGRFLITNHGRFNLVLYYLQLWQSNSIFLKKT